MKEVSWCLTSLEDTVVGEALWRTNSFPNRKYNTNDNILEINLERSKKYTFVM